MSIRIVIRGLIAILWIGVLSTAVLRAQSPGSFIGITPCRVVDTRGPSGPFGGPIITGGTSRTFSIPAGPCKIPSSQLAYSLNITVVPSGPLGYITVWPYGQSQPLASTLDDASGLVLSNAAIIQAGANGAIEVFASNTTHLIIDINGYFAPQTNSSTDNTAFGIGVLSSNTSGSGNTAVGFETLQVNTSGFNNTAIGSGALQSNGSGYSNTAVGVNALNLNTGDGNSAFGTEALASNTQGTSNTALGYNALSSNSVGDYNTAVGGGALSGNTAGDNTAVGYDALPSQNSGSNIAIGYKAGYYVVNGGNIEIGNAGTGEDSNVIRIGAQANQTSAYIAGIYGATVTGSAVLVNSNGQLGIASSSARYKQDVHAMGDSSDALMQLRPVTFRYKQAAEDGSRPLQYGLIGEEVEKVYPELVVHGRDGQVESVMYHELPALLLNEVEKQHGQIQQQEHKIGQQKEQIRSLEARIAALESMLRGGGQSPGSAIH